MPSLQAGRARKKGQGPPNLVSILTVSGEIKEAHRYADEADSRIGKLAELDRVHGNFFILKGNLAFRSRVPDEASGWAAAARSFYDRVGIYSYDFRIANLECLLQKIAYAKADYPNSLERGERCVSMLTKGAPGKLDNLSDSIYYSFKAKMMTGQKPFQAIIFEQLRGDDTPPLVKTRLELAQRFVEASIDISKGREARGRDHLSKLVSDAVSWEYDSGGLYDLTSDIIVSSNAGRFEDALTKTLDQ
jgi:hypothetical protein